MFKVIEHYILLLYINWQKIQNGEKQKIQGQNVREEK